MRFYRWRRRLPSKKFIFHETGLVSSVLTSTESGPDTETVFQEVMSGNEE